MQSGSPTTGSTLSISQNLGGTESGIYYDVNLTTTSNDQPAVGADGKPAFCQPVPPPANPIQVTMVIDPGNPTDGITVSCPTSPSFAVPLNFWISDWKNYHESEIVLSGFAIQNWQITPAGDP